MSVEVDLPWETWTRPQWEWFQWKHSKSISIEFLGGGYGSAKTTGAIRRFIRLVLPHRKTEAFGQDAPKSALIAPTFGVLEQTVMPKFWAAVPKELVLKDRSSYAKLPHIDLINGHRIILASAEAEFEGIDLCVVYCEEIHKANFTRYPHRFANYLARLRENRTNAPKALIAVGLPEFGQVREWFDVADDPANLSTPARFCRLVSSYENPYLDKMTIEAVLTSCSPEEADTMVRGKWGAPPGAAFPSFDTKIHVVDDVGDPGAPVDLGIDIGRHGAIEIGQRRTWQDAKNVVGQKQSIDGLLIVDEILTNGETLEAAIMRFKTETPWQVLPQRSKIFVDPTIRLDEASIVRRHFPGVHLVIRDRGDDLWPVEPGIRLLRAKLKDATGNVYVRFAKKLAGNKRGVVEGLMNARSNPRTGELYAVDDRRDHPVDALRYLVCGLLGRAPGGMVVHHR